MMRRKIGLCTVFCVVWACGGLPDLWWEEMESGECALCDGLVGASEG